MAESVVISVLLAVSHPLVRRALQVALDNEPDLRIVGESPNSRSVVPLVRSLCPRVLVLDMTLEDGDSFGLIAAVCLASHQTRIVAVANHDSSAYLFETIRNGAAGFVPNGSGLTPLLAAVRTVAAGDIYLCPPWNEQTLRAHNGASGMVAGLTALTTRERELLRLLGRGLDCGAIAEQLAISVRTAETLCLTMQRKLNLPTHADLVRYAAGIQQ
jgi:DNA-binding NarL/FixJ family response regulator